MADLDVPQAFKSAMRRLAATVTILSTGNADIRHGMTATAVTSVSTDPATLLVCVNQKAAMHAHLGVGSRMCVNLLRSVHADVSRAFSGQMTGDERFTVGEWSTDEAKVPFLLDAQANLFCDIKVAVPYATHTIFIGEVYGVRLHEEISPLIYQDGDYVSVTSTLLDIS